MRPHSGAGPQLAARPCSVTPSGAPSAASHHLGVKRTAIQQRDRSGPACPHWRRAAARYLRLGSIFNHYPRVEAGPLLHSLKASPLPPTSFSQEHSLPSVRTKLTTFCFNRLEC